MLASYDPQTIKERLARRGALVPDISTSDRQAAVALILRASETGEAEILFIQRAENTRDPWSGHMAFPGGRRDATDESLLATAIRETREEVGVDLASHADLLARLEDVEAVARGKRLGMTIGAFVFALRAPHAESSALALNDEVAATIWSPLGPIARGERAAIFPYRHEGVVLELPSLALGSSVVWGLTHQITRALLAALDA